MFTLGVFVLVSANYCGAERNAVEHCVIVLNVIGYTFKGSSSVVFCFASILNRGQLSKERSLLSQEQMLSIKIRPNLERDISSREANSESKHFFSLLKMSVKCQNNNDMY